MSLPTWEPWVSKTLQGKSKGEWNLEQVQKYLKVKPNHKAKDLLQWVLDPNIHPINPFPNADRRKFERLLGKVKSNKRKSNEKRKSKKDDSSS